MVGLYRQVVIETNGNITSNSTTGFIQSGYELIDSPANLFMKYNTKYTNKISSKIKFGVEAGIRFNYQLKQSVSVNISILVSNNSISRTTTAFSNFIDSSLITLERYGTGPWLDPTNGYTVYRIYGIDVNGVYAGYTVGTPKTRQFLNPPSKEIIKFTCIDIPIGFTLVPTKSKFSFYGEIGPMILLKSSINRVFYDVDGSEITPATSPNTDQTNSPIWRFGIGVNYKIKQRFEVGIKYKQSLNTLVNYDDIKFKSFGLQITYSLPDIKL